MGFTLYYRRLEEGTFEPLEYDREIGSIRLSYTQIVMLVDGLSIKKSIKGSDFRYQNNLLLMPK